MLNGYEKCSEIQLQRPINDLISILRIQKSKHHAKSLPFIKLPNHKLRRLWCGWQPEEP